MVDTVTIEITSDDLAIVAPAVPPQIRIENLSMVEAFDGDFVHPLACFHRKWRAAAPAQEAYTTAVCTLEDTLTDEQLPLWHALDEAEGVYQCALMDHLVDVLATHFPGLAGAIRAVAWHDDSRDGTGAGECCTSPMQSADDPKTTALRFTYEYARRSAQMDVDLDHVLSPLSSEDRKDVLARLGELMEWVDANWPDSANGSPSWPPARRAETAPS